MIIPKRILRKDVSEMLHKANCINTGSRILVQALSDLQVLGLALLQLQLQCTSIS